MESKSLFFRGSHVICNFDFIGPLAHWPIDGIWWLGTDFPEQSFMKVLEITIPETNVFAPETRLTTKRKFIFQPSIFRGEMLVSGRVGDLPLTKVWQIGDITI